MSKKKVTNTAETFHYDWLMGGNPSAIEAQEAQGQKELVESSQLPSKVNHPYGTDLKKTYAELGIEVLEESSGDSLFLDVVLPEGWKLESTDHSMWNRLVDDKGRERATIFYKAAFYDRDAFINFNKRYYFTSEYVEKEEGDEYTPKFYCVKDIVGDKILFKTEVTKEYHDEKLSAEAEAWLKENYPDHENITAYWD
jgi:hypothetical protein